MSVCFSLCVCAVSLNECVFFVVCVCVCVCVCAVSLNECVFFVVCVLCR